MSAQGGTKHPSSNQKRVNAEPLQVNPASAKARLLLQLFGPDNIGRALVDELMLELYEKFGDQREPSAEAIQHIREFYRRHKELSDPVRKLVTAFKPSNPIHFEDQPELYAASRPKFDKGGKQVGLSDLKDCASFCSNDVLQQTPQALDVDVDQQHVVTNWKPTASNQMPDARWTTVVGPEIIKARDDVYFETNHGVTQVYKIKEEEIHLKLNRTTTVEVDTVGRVVRCNGYKGDEGASLAKSKSRKFRRTGQFDQTVVPSRGDYLTPKVDGEPLYIAATGGAVGLAVGRMGDQWEFESDRTIRILVECVPSVEQPERIYLTHAWRVGTVNNIGVMYSKELLKRKKIVITLQGVTLPVEFPSFESEGMKSDGYVLHKGRAQYFFKLEPSVDIELPQTKRALQETFGERLVVDWMPGRCEYTVEWVGDKLHLKYLKRRFNKPRENDMFNIQEVCNAPPIESWVTMFEENGVIRL